MVITSINCAHSGGEFDALDWIVSRIRYRIAGRVSRFVSECRSVQLQHWRSGRQDRHAVATGSCRRDPDRDRRRFCLQPSVEDRSRNLRRAAAGRGTTDEHHQRRDRVLSCVPEGFDESSIRPRTDAGQLAGRRRNRVGHAGQFRGDLELYHDPVEPQLFGREQRGQRYTPAPQRLHRWRRPGNRRGGPHQRQLHHARNACRGSLFLPAGGFIVERRVPLAIGAKADRAAGDTLYAGSSGLDPQRRRATAIPPVRAAARS